MSDSDIAEERCRGIFRPISGESLAAAERPVADDWSGANVFVPFTRESLAALEQRIAEEEVRKKTQPRTQDEDFEEPQPNPLLEVGATLPEVLQAVLPPELMATPLEDIDKFYESKKSFMVISKGKDIFRFSADDALYIFSPFNPVRRVAIYILVHPIFSFFVIVTILANCILMTMSGGSSGGKGGGGGGGGGGGEGGDGGGDTADSTEIIFTSIYTFESCIKCLARGFILAQFTYLRDPWNWLDFVVISLAYITMFIPLGNLSALRTFRVLRALKTVAILPGLKTIVGAVIESVKNLKDVIILTLFSLSVFALLGLQIYSGVLRQTCVRNYEGDIMSDEQYYDYIMNKSNWGIGSDDRYILCGNGTGAWFCEENYTCLPGLQNNPNYGYTNFDYFHYALLCAFRLMTQDFWEDLYQLVLRAAGSWHMTFFVVNIFLGSLYLLNLILAIVAMSYDDLQKKAEEEEQYARDQQQVLIETFHLPPLPKSDEHMTNEDVGANSPSDTSSCGYDVYDKGTDDMTKQDKMSIQSDGGDSIIESKPRANGKVRKASLSLPGSPFNVRRGSRGSHQLPWRPNGRRFGDKKPLVLSTFLDAQEHLPYADDSTAVTPMSEENGAIIVPVYASIASRHGSYTSHGSRMSYTSHGDINSQPITKETQLRSRRNLQTLVPEVVIDSKPDYGKALSIIARNAAFATNYAEESSTDSEDFMMKHKHPLDNNPFLEPPQRNALVDMKDVMVLNDIFEQAAGRRCRGSDQADEEEGEKPKWKERCVACCLKYLDIFCLWDCCVCWVKIQAFLSLIIYDPFVELFITLCIVVNTLFMAMDHHGMNDDMNNFLKGGNVFFTTTFGIEAFLKLLAVSPKNYFKEGWNIFDFLIVTLSFVEVLLEDVQGLSVLRSFRLLRVFKLAKSWPTLNLLISIMGKAIGAIGNLTFVLAIIIFIFAVMGMQLFGKSYVPTAFETGEVPRWNFTDFMHSFMIVFRVLCGEWIESMWDCIYVAGWPCVPFFLATVVIGYLVALNLFLALLLSSFGASTLTQGPADNETNKLAEAIDRISRFIAWVKRRCRMLALSAMKAIRAKVTNQIADQTTEIREVDMDDTTGEIVDGQVPMRDKKSPKEHLALEVTLNDGVEITIHGDSVKMENKASQWNNKPICNSIKKPEEKDNKDKEKEQQVNLLPKKPKRPEEDALSDNSLSSYKGKIRDVTSKSTSRRTSSASLSEGEEKKDACKDDVDSDLLDENMELEDQDVPLDHVDGDEYGDEIESEMESSPPCLSPWFYAKFPWCATTGTPFWDAWTSSRNKMFRLIENKYFETFIIIMILLSSLALALEDKEIDQKIVLKHILVYMDRVFTVIFFFEMIIKWHALGFQKYFNNAWCWLDFIIVVLSIMNLGAVMAGASNIAAFRSMRTLRALRPLRAVSRWEGMRLSIVNLIAIFLQVGNIPAFRSMRTLRALRPLRALSRLQGMRVVVNALVQAIPSIFNVLLVCLIFWLIFAIMGVQTFGGKYYKCLYLNGSKVHPDIIGNKTACEAKNFTWNNSLINFDNVGQAYLALFQVATFKGWMTIMDDAVDNTGLNNQPRYEASIHMYLYFVFFIIFGTFFTLNLFIGVIIDNFNEQKKKAGGSLEMFMTEDQKKYYNAMKKMGSKKPLKAIPRPRFKLQAIVFDITTNTKFDMVIMLFIALNMVCMALDHHDQSPEFENILNYLNLLFIVIFTSECCLKIFALRWYYFKEPWNMFDFIVVILSILGIALKEFIETYFVSPTLLRVVRVVKVGRVLRLVKGAKGIRTLLFALAMSLPALFNICLLLFLVMFIYAIFGMSFFMHVKHSQKLDKLYNFETFGHSIILLFQMSTSAGWHDVLYPLMNVRECEPATDNSQGNCGNPLMAIIFLVSYLIINCIIVINMFIAVILENYSQATDEVQEGLTDDDYDMYYEIWQRFDPEGTQFIRYDQLSELFDTLEPPLQIHKPNKYKIVSMDIPIYKNDYCYCVDILDALTKDFFARKGSAIEEPGDMQEVVKTERAGYEQISSTLWRQREEFCARLIQKAWRRHYKVKSGDQVSCVTTTQDASSAADAQDSELKQQQTAIVIESDGHVTKNGHKVVIHSRSPSITSRSTDV